jgi:multicomponent Na+:H+ antiporter subunit E
MTKKSGAILLFVLLLGFWIVLATRWDLTTIIAGFIVSAMIVFYNYDLIFNHQEATVITLRYLKALVIFVFVLLFSIIKSNVQVAIIVLSEKMPINPGFQTIRQPLKKAMNQAMYGNAITLTPGTLSIDMDDEHILVHGLIVDTVKELEGSALEKAVIAFEEVIK